jgi:hypothetical protein
LESNANSVHKEKAELEIFLQTNAIDIAAICETKLLPKYKFNTPGYKAYRSDRNEFGRGVMFLVVNDLRHDSLTLPPN